MINYTHKLHLGLFPSCTFTGFVYTTVRQRKHYVLIAVVKVITSNLQTFLEKLPLKSTNLQMQKHTTKGGNSFNYESISKPS